MASVDSKMMRKYCELMERNLKEVMDPGVFEWLVGCSVYDSTPAFHLKDLTVVIPVASFADADISSWVVREMPLDEKRQPRIWIPPMDWELSVTKRMRTRVRSIFTQPDNTDASKINDLTFEIVIRIVRELGAKDTSSFYGATRLLYAFYSLQGSGEYGRVERLRGLKAAHRVTEHKVPGGIPYDDVRRQLEAHQLIGPRNRKFLHKTLEGGLSFNKPGWVKHRATLEQLWEQINEGNKKPFIRILIDDNPRPRSNGQMRLYELHDVSKDEEIALQNTPARSRENRYYNWDTIGPEA